MQSITLKDSVVIYDKDRLYVLYVANLQAKILRRNYDNITAGYFRFARTYNAIAKKYF